MARLSGRALIDQYTTENRALPRELLGQLSAPGNSGAAAMPLETYWVDVELSAISDAEIRERMRAVPTSFSVSRRAVDQLICSGRQLLRNAPDFQRLLRDLGGSVNAANDKANAC